jgi:hypothetical protein
MCSRLTKDCQKYISTETDPIPYITLNNVNKTITPEFHVACIRIGVIKVRVCAYASPKITPAIHTTTACQEFDQI